MPLTPQQIEEMRRRGYILDGGKTYFDMGASGAGGDNPDLQSHFGGYMEADHGGGAADSYQGKGFRRFDASGAKTGEGIIDWMNDPGLKEYWPMLALAAAPFAGAALMGTGMFAGGAAAGGAGAMGPMTAAEAAAGSSALHSSLAPYAAGGATAGGAASTLGELGTMESLPLMEMPAGMEASAFTPSAAMSSAISKLPAAGSSLLDKIPGASSLTGPAAAVLGGLLGSKPQEQGGTTTQKMDPRMDKLFYEDLAPRVQGLLAQQSPIAQQYGQQLGQMGQGLLSIQPAGNGFERFTRGRY